MQKILPHLWFASQAEEVASFYGSVFRNSKVGTVTHYGSAGYDIHKMPEGTAMTVEWEIEGFRFMAINAGPVFTLNPSISFFCNFDPSRDPDAAAYLDQVWERLADGGTVRMPLQTYPFSPRYGWVDDKYGVSWQLILSDPEGEERSFIVPSLLFTQEGAGRAEEAMDFYRSVFKDARQGQLARYPAGMEPEKEGTVMYADFMLAGQWFAAMDSAGPHDFAFNEALSFLVLCDSQEEIDHYWNALSAVPAAEQCGWLKDQFGVSWQIAPRDMEELMRDEDRAKADRVMNAMLQMKKLDIAALRAAAGGA